MHYILKGLLGIYANPENLKIWCSLVCFGVFSYRNNDISCTRAHMLARRHAPQRKTLEFCASWCIYFDQI